jgi:hypothetical protein
LAIAAAGRLILDSQHLRCPMPRSSCQPTSDNPSPYVDLLTSAPADQALEDELQELAAEYASRTARERCLVATILLSGASAKNDNDCWMPEVQRRAVHRT